MVELLGYYTLFCIGWVWTSNQSLGFTCHCEALNISERENRERLFLIKKKQNKAGPKVHVVFQYVAFEPVMSLHT